MAKFLVLASLLALAFADPRLLSQGYSKSKTTTGATTYQKQTEGESHTVVYAPSLEEMKIQYLTRTTEKLEETRDKKLQGTSDTITCDWGDGPDYYRFIPQYEGSAKKGEAPINFSGHCFQEMTWEVTMFTDTSVTVAIIAEKPIDLLCYDTFLIATLNNYHLAKIDRHGTHTFQFKNLNAGAVTDVNFKGVRLFWFCDDIADLVVDLMMTLEMFLGGFTTHSDWPIIGSHTTWYMEEANRKFLNASIGYDMKKRDVHKININKNDIHTGDFLAVARLDGLDEVIMYGSGSKVGHSTVAFWSDIDGEMDLYILESQAGWYWPRTGIQMNKFDQWIQWADDASFNVAVLPLKPEVRAAFNSDSAWEWFKTVQGLPYGYHNFAFGWIDTPYDNMPPLLNAEFLPIGLAITEDIIPASIATMFGQALNKRLNTTGLSIKEMGALAYSRGMTLLDVMAMVEVEGWIYSDGMSYVCSSFVLSFYKNAGILGDIVVYGPEFTPRDVYTLDIFDSQSTLPAACTQEDPMNTLPYCQILGDYRIDLGSEFGTIPSYEHMCERCPTIAPTFYRPDGC